MDNILVDHILNMYNSPERVRLVMPTPSSRKQVRDSRSGLDEELNGASKCTESETGYVKDYVQQEEEEYIKVV